MFDDLKTQQLLNKRTRPLFRAYYSKHSSLSLSYINFK